MNPPYLGMNTRELFDMLRKLGGTVRDIPDSGETECTHPKSRRRPRVNRRNKTGVPALYLLVKDAYNASKEVD